MSKIFITSITLVLMKVGHQLKGRSAIHGLRKKLANLLSPKIHLVWKITSKAWAQITHHKVELPWLAWNASALVHTLYLVFIIKLSRLSWSNSKLATYQVIIASLLMIRDWIPRPLPLGTGKQHPSSRSEDYPHQVDYPTRISKKTVQAWWLELWEKWHLQEDR